MNGFDLFGVHITPWHILGLIVAIILMWVARKYAHRVIRALFFGLSHWAGVASRILMGAAATLHERYCESVVAYRAKQLARELETLETKVGARIPRYEADIGKLAVVLDQDAQKLAGAMEQLSEHTPSAYAIQAFREGLRDAGADRPQARVNQALRSFKLSFAAEMRKLRAELVTLRTSAPKLVHSAERFKTIQADMSRLAEKANTAFEKFDEALQTDNYEQLAAKQSILFPWLAALLVMAIALSGVFLNFFLIQRPLAEMVGQGFQVLGVDLPVIAAIVVILLEFIAGVVLFEAAGVTHMIFHDMTPMTRRILFGTAIAFLITFSVFEAFIALQRDVLIHLEEQTRAAATGETVAERKGVSLSTIAQVLLGVVIPWLLAVAAIPLETVLNMGWMIIQLIAHQLMAFVGLLLRMLSAALRSLGLFVLDIYDLVIFLPLAIESMIKSFNKGRTPDKGADHGPPPDSSRQPGATVTTFPGGRS